MVTELNKPSRSFQFVSAKAEKKNNDTTLSLAILEKLSVVSCLEAAKV